MYLRSFTVNGWTVGSLVRTRRETSSSSSSWQVYAQTTDCGPNEVAARKIHHKLFHATSSRTLFFSMDCSEHAVHLCVLGSLKELEEHLVQLEVGWKYFSSCAMIANVLRDNCREFFRAWQDLYGTKDAIICAKTLFPKCLAGRWGSIHAFEDRMLLCGKKILGFVCAFAVL